MDGTDTNRNKKHPKGQKKNQKIQKKHSKHIHPRKNAVWKGKRKYEASLGRKKETNHEKHQQTRGDTDTYMLLLDG